MISSGCDGKTTDTNFCHLFFLVHFSFLWLCNSSFVFCCCCSIYRQYFHFVLNFYLFWEVFLNYFLLLPSLSFVLRSYSNSLFVYLFIWFLLLLLIINYISNIRIISNKLINCFLYIYYLLFIYIIVYHVVFLISSERISRGNLKIILPYIPSHTHTHTQLFLLCPFFWVPNSSKKQQQHQQQPLVVLSFLRRLRDEESQFEWLEGPNFYNDD